MTLVEIKGKELLASTLTIANGVGLEHRAVISLVSKYQKKLNKYRVMTFEMSKPKNGRPARFYWLNEKQATFLITLMKNSGIVVDFKEKLTDEYYKLKEAIVNQKSAEWIDKRDSGKLTHRAKTDTIKTFTEYAKKQGSKSAKMYYMNIAKMENAAFFLLQEKYPNVRDLLTSGQLSSIETADNVVSKALREGMEDEMPYKDIYKMAKDRVLAMAELVGKSIVPMFNQEQLPKE